MRILLFMPLEVYLQVPFCGKAIAADVAFEGPLSCMGAQVDLQSAVAAKYFGTEPAFMLEEGLLWAGLGFEQGHVRQFPFPVLHQSCKGVKCISCGGDASQGIGENDTAGGALR